MLGFDPGGAGSIPAPAIRELQRPVRVLDRTNNAGSSNGKMRRSERRDVVPIPAPAA